MNMPHPNDEGGIRPAHAEHLAPPARDELAEARAITFEPLHPNARWGMGFGQAVLTSLPIAGPSVALLLASGGLGSFGANLAAWLALTTAAFAIGWRLGLARFRHTRFALDDAGLRIRRGLWWRTETVVPRSRVQHTDINRGPLDRRLGLSTLKIHTAGTRLAQVTLAGLPEARAIQLRDELVAAGGDGL